MFGLIKKDLFMIKGNLKIIIAMLFVFIVMAISGNENFSFILAFISVTVMMSTFSYDEYNKSDAFIITLPNGKKNVVRSKYVATLFIVFVSILLTVFVSVVIGFMQHNLDIKELFCTTIGCCFGVLLLQSIMYPLIFKYGIEKSRIGMFVGVFGIIGIISLFQRSGLQFHISQEVLTVLNQYWHILLSFVISICLFISYKISAHLYAKKQF